MDQQGKENQVSHPATVVGINLAYLSTGLACAAYLTVVFMNMVKEAMWAKPVAGLVFCLYAAFMLFAVDRGRWAGKFEGHRAAMNMALVMTPCVGEILEVFEGRVKDFLIHYPWSIEVMFFVAVIAFVIAFVELLVEKI